MSLGLMVLDLYKFDDIENAIKLIQSKEIIKRLNETAKKHRIDIKNEEHEVFGL